MRKKIFSKHPLFVNKNNFNEAQLNSWEWFKEDGLKELFDEFSPIKDFANKDFTLWIDDYYFDAPLLTEREAKAKGISYEAPLRVKLKLENKKTGEILRLQANPPLSQKQELTTRDFMSSYQYNFEDYGTKQEPEKEIEVQHG